MKQRGAFRDAQDPVKRPSRFIRRSGESCVIDVSAACHLAPLLRICSLIPSISGVTAGTGELEDGQ